MNILISSVGRQVYLVNAFKDALKNYGKVIVADNNINASALNAADISLISPTYNSKDYLLWLYEICEKHEIKLLITLNVDELLILELQREFLNKIGCVLLGGDYETIKVTYDKLALSRFAERIGLNTPKVYSRDDLRTSDDIFFPLIAKPRYGKGSRGQHIIDSPNSLKEYLNNSNVEVCMDETYIFQQFIKGDEYGLDIINDFNSNYVSTFVRQKYSMKNGETFEAITKPQDEWVGIAKILSKNINHQGSIDVDFMVQDNIKYLIDINHRFGGGYIFSHAAGADLPRTFINWFLNKPIERKWLHPLSEVLSKRNGSSIELLSK